MREVRFVLNDDKAYRRFVDVATAMLLGSDEAFKFDDTADAQPSLEEASSAPTVFVAQQPSTRPDAARPEE